jgi:hypothetical protein
MNTAQFNRLRNFLGAWFPDADIEGLGDKEVVESFLNTPNKQEHGAVRHELAELLRLVDLPVETISKEANRHFESDAECRRWLEQVAEWLGGKI